MLEAEQIHQPPSASNQHRNITRNRLKAFKKSSSNSQIPSSSSTPVNKKQVSGTAKSLPRVPTAQTQGMLAKTSSTLPLHSGASMTTSKPSNDIQLLQTAAHDNNNQNLPDYHTGHCNHGNSETNAQRVESETMI